MKFDQSNCRIRGSCYGFVQFCSQASYVLAVVFSCTYTRPYGSPGGMSDSGSRALSRKRRQWERYGRESVRKRRTNLASAYDSVLNSQSAVLSTSEEAAPSTGPGPSTSFT